MRRPFFSHRWLSLIHSMRRKRPEGLRLQQMQRFALCLLGAMACLYGMATYLHKTHPVWAFVAAFSEAAMVGALADWFAVVALFRHPLGIPIPHTAIIPKNKHHIADNLAFFVRDKFLGVDTIAALIRQHDPAHALSAWLVQADNTARLGQYLVQFAGHSLDFIEDAPVQQLITQAVHTALNRVDISASAGIILESLTKNGHHQALLDEGLHQFATRLNDRRTQALIARHIVLWLQEKHPIVEFFLPSNLIGKKAATLAVRTVSRLLNDINGDKQHPVRLGFTAYTEELIQKLRSDPAFIAKGEDIKRYLQNDATLNTYLKSLWASLKDWLQNDINSNHSRLHHHIVMAGQWLGQQLANDEALRHAVNMHISESAKTMAPEFAAFLTQHISDTVKSWDSVQMAEQIERSIGSDLQFIRMSGTIVGGLVGLGIYCLSYFFR